MWPEVNKTLLNLLPILVGAAIALATQFLFFRMNRRKEREDKLWQRRFDQLTELEKHVHAIIYTVAFASEVDDEKAKEYIENVNSLQSGLPIIWRYPRVHKAFDELMMAIRDRFLSNDQAERKELANVINEKYQSFVGSVEFTLSKGFKMK